MIPLDSPDKRLFPAVYADVPTVTTNTTTSPEVSYEKALARAGETIARLTRERDEAVAQRDLAVKVCRLVEWGGYDECAGQICPDCEAPEGGFHSDGCVLAAVLRSDPIPDRLAAGAREAVARAIFSRLWGAMPDVFGPAFEHDQDLFQLAADDAIRVLSSVSAIDRLGAEREAGRQQGLEDATKAFKAWFGPPGRRWRHVKRGTEYVEIGRAYLQTSRPVTDMTPMVVYKGESGLWVRPGIEFDDGRFVEIRALRYTPAPPETGKT